jgi:hypothetical protein
MSVEINGHNIKMTHGDTFRAKLDIKDNNGNDYIPSEGDVIRFAVKRKYDDDELCIFKKIPIDTLEIHLLPKDTKSLEQPCEYVYDIQITMADGTVDTFINGKLIITQEVD